MKRISRLAFEAELERIRAEQAVEGAESVLSAVEARLGRPGERA